MKFAERFGMSPTELAAQPIDLVLRWLDYAEAEAEAASFQRARNAR